MRIALGLEYGGAGYCGWQSQPSACAIQDQLERALAAVADHRVQVVAAGRTDAGVHALAQVVHFDSDAQRPVSAWVRGVNSRLPTDIAVCWAQPTLPEFHARFSALARSYIYVLLNHSVRPALWRGRVGWYHRRLEVERMQAAANHLLGEHDFSSFRGADCQARTTTRTLMQARVSRQADVVTFEFQANAFLHHMVRNIVGSLVQVGSGERPIQWMAEVLTARDRTQAAATFAADGLYLSRIEYAPEWGIPVSAARAPIALER